MNHENAVANERKRQRANSILSHFYKMLTICKSLETESRLVFSRGWDKGKSMLNGYGSPSGMMKMFWNWLVVAQLCKYTTCACTKHIL